MKIFLLSVHPPQGGGSAHSSQELAVGLRSLGHFVLHAAPYRSQTDRTDYPDLVWFPADFPDGLPIAPEAQQAIDQKVQELYHQYGKFDWVILGRESFLWHIPAIRAIHPGLIAVISRGAYINKLAGAEAVESNLREQLINLYRRCDRIICIAQHLVTSIHRVVGEAPAVFLSNPINLSAFQVVSPRQPLPEEPIQILMAAQLKSRKRPLDAVEIMRLLVTQGADCYLTICGEGPDRQEMNDRIKTYGLEERISFQGKLPREAVLPHLQRAEIVLLCSDNEGRPRVLQEAIAAGKAIVAYDNPGSREVITNWIAPWELGRLVAIGDIAGAAVAILDLAKTLRHTPPELPKIPSSQQVLTQYESLLKELRET